MEEFSLSGPAQRLLLALTVSVALHFALIFLVKVAPPQSNKARNIVIEVRLEEVSQPTVKAAIAALTQKQTEIPLPKLESAPVKPVEPPKPIEQKPLPAAVQAEEKSPLPSVEVPLVEDPTFYPAKQLDIQPKALAPVNPVFPDKAANDNVSGEVTLLLLIDEAGKVRDLAVVDAKPEGYFDESALSAFRNTRWAPAQKDGRIVKSRVMIRVRYELGRDGGKVGF